MSEFRQGGAMGNLCIIYREKGTKLYKLTDKELRESRISFGYDYSGTQALYNDDGDEIEVEYFVNKYNAIDSAVGLAKSYPSFTRDAWVVDDDGTVLAVVSFSVNVAYP
jgi:hypothetical protein